MAESTPTSTTATDTGREATDTKATGSPNIQILIACHEDDVQMPKSEHLLPVQVDCVRTGKHFSGMAHDDDGENISAKNAMYCELTALYWAWKNLDADYYGLMHYRRYFSFSDENMPTNMFGDILKDANDAETLRALAFDDAHIESVVEAHPLILPSPGAFVGNPTMEEQFRESWQLRETDLDLLREIVAERSPEIAPYFESYFKGRSGYFCNMFIMSKELFEPYCEWLFGVLEEHERRGDYSNYDVDEYRVSGYLAERLLGVWAAYLAGERGICPHELQKAFFQNVVRAPKALHPAFGSQSAHGEQGSQQGTGAQGMTDMAGAEPAPKEAQEPVTAVMAASDNYVPYLSVLLQSIADTASSERKYDLVVMTTDISKDNQALLKAQIERSNISLRFYDVGPVALNRMGDLKLRGHFQIETYYRLLMQEIFADWDKALYLDSDMVVLRDIAELFDTDVSAHLLAACKDADTAGLYNGYDPARKEYMDDMLRIKEPYEYFQAGTILFNLAKFRETYDVDSMLALASQQSWKLLDQDVLNMLAQGCVKHVPMEWNVMTDWRGIRIKRIIRRAPKFLYDEYMAARKTPAIVHYAGTEKPWDDPDSDMAHHFWRFARKTPFYESMLAKLAKSGGKKKPISDAAWDALYPMYSKAFPDRSRRREVTAAIYRKVVAGKKS